MHAQVATESLNHTGVRGTGHPLKVMIAGAPAAGKGTQCEKIVQKARVLLWPSCCMTLLSQRAPVVTSAIIPAQFGLVHVSAGDLLRAEVTAETEAGKRAETFMSQGYLVPNELVRGFFA